MADPKAHVTCIVVRSAKLAEQVERHVKPFTLVYYPGCATMGIRIDTIINTLHPQEILDSPRIREWFETALRTRLKPNGVFIHDYLDIAMANPNLPWGPVDPKTEL